MPETMVSGSERSESMPYSVSLKGLFCAVLCTGLLTTTNSTWAGGLYLTPELQMRNASGGQTLQFPITVRNQTTARTSVVFTVENACPGWSAWVNPPTMTMEALASSTMVLTVIAPIPPGCFGCTIQVDAWQDETIIDSAFGLVSCPTSSPAPAVEITSFDWSGVGWSNSLPDLIGALEWAPSINGPWHQSWQGCEWVDAPNTGMILQVPVPRFFRIASAARHDGMALVEEGPFQMGDQSGDGYENERPAHTVQQSAFYIDKYEVSSAQWHDVRNWALTNGYTDLSTGTAAIAVYNHPVVQITWFDAVKWCNARSEKEGLVPVYYTYRYMEPYAVYRNNNVNPGAGYVNWLASGYRLPTESEWEKAARGGLYGHHYPWQSHNGHWYDTFNPWQANYYNSDDPFTNSTTPVGYYNGAQQGYGSSILPVHVCDMVNGFGLYDMAGNASEWCWDWYYDRYYDATPYENPRGPAAGTYRMYRGGSWYDSVFELRCSFRTPFYLPNERSDVVGFRCVRIP
jgi:formylglycine-generating enzyme required for sulfatase activity